MEDRQCRRSRLIPGVNDSGRRFFSITTKISRRDPRPYLYCRQREITDALVDLGPVHQLGQLTRSIGEHLAGKPARCSPSGLPGEVLDDRPGELTELMYRTEVDQGIGDLPLPAVQVRAWVPSRDLSGDREEPTPAVIYTGDETRPGPARAVRAGVECRSPGPVSYTHLRAHETRHDIVCRLLLEKK